MTKGSHVTAQTPPTPPFRDPHLPFAKRIDDLLRRLTLDEKISFLQQFAPAVERLGVDAFRTGQEALHGVAWMGPATVFPQAVGLGATWNTELVRRIGEAVGKEARAMRAHDERVEGSPAARRRRSARARHRQGIATRARRRKGRVVGRCRFATDRCAPALVPSGEGWSGTYRAMVAVR